ncbi:phage tail protein [Pseudomonas sp. B21-032]|uniref:phage tail protein n=1 Tax=Pseudomonas sp. B21-032 TaxID=2895483 RepID=UPI00215EF5BB|nr:phage tail protein [Pseudomonas sp. B21-032]UVL59814.1 phage tail protein [Pseudomonas sp. B21-032]
MPWSRAGTVAVTAGQKTVTGTGTAFTLNGRVGDAWVGPDGRQYEVTNIISPTSLSIEPGYLGSTVTAGTYALVPIQGWPKAAADRMHQIIDQWGVALSSLGAVSTENVVPVTKGGTGGTTQAGGRNGLGLKTAAVADIVGTVSQASGVPTGAIIESGTNANGEYVKFANGTLICTAAVVLEFSSATTLLKTWPFPAAFSAAPKVTATPIQGSSADSAPVTFAEYGPAMAASINTVQCVPRLWRTAGGTNSFISTSVVTAHCHAIGRWFN